MIWSVSASASDDSAGEQSAGAQKHSRRYAAKHLVKAQAWVAVG